MEIEDRHKTPCGSIATCQEKGKKFILNKATGFVKVAIDGEVIPKSSKTQRCDFLLFKEEERTRKIEIFVELKGVNVEKAIEQLDSSLQMFGKANVQYAFAIVTNMPTVITTAIQKKKEAFKKKHIKLIIKTKSAQCDYDSAKNTLLSIRN